MVFLWFSSFVKIHLRQASKARWKGGTHGPEPDFWRSHCWRCAKPPGRGAQRKNGAGQHPMGYPLVMSKQLLEMSIEIVSFTTKHGDFL